MVTTERVESFVEIVEHGLIVTPAYYPKTFAPDKTEAVCSCRNGEGCLSPGKHPVADGWNSDESAQVGDPDDVEEIWSEYPEFNALVITGVEIDGGFLAVLDVDDKSELMAMVDHVGRRMPRTAVAKTGRAGGLHIYLRFKNRPPNVDCIDIKEKLFQVEVKSLGKAVVAPGSTHFTGKSYRWMRNHGIADVGIADAPDWLEDALSQAKKAPAGSSSSPKGSSVDLVQRIFDDGLSEGERNDVLFRYVCSVRARGFSWKETEGHLRTANRAANPPLDDEELEEILKSARRYVDGKPQVSSYQSRMSQPKREVEFVIEKLVPVGLTLIAGGKSVGKSQLAIDAGLAVCNGSLFLGHFPVKEGPVLYLDLEGYNEAFDGRIGQRLKGAAPKHLLSSIHLTDIALEVEFLKWFEDVLDDLPDVRLVVIDTLGDVIRVSGRGNAYLNEKKALVPLHQIALQRKIALLVVHHTRQGIADDDVEQISGTSGLVANCDVWGVLRRPRKQTLGTLIVGGKVIKGVEVQYALEFDQVIGCWSYKGLAEDVVGNHRHRLILEVLNDADETLTPKEIRGLLEELHGVAVKEGTMYSDLHRLRKAGKIVGKRSITVLKPAKKSPQQAGASSL